MENFIFCAVLPFNVWDPLKGYTYLKAVGLFKYVWPFIGYQVLKG